jgi:hypothetical protein
MIPSLVYIRNDGYQTFYCTRKDDDTFSQWFYDTLLDPLNDASYVYPQGVTYGPHDFNATSEGIFGDFRNWNVTRHPNVDCRLVKAETPCPLGISHYEFSGNNVSTSVLGGHACTVVDAIASLDNRFNMSGTLFTPWLRITKASDNHFTSTMLRAAFWLFAQYHSTWFVFYLLGLELLAQLKVRYLTVSWRADRKVHKVFRVFLEAFLVYIFITAAIYDFRAFGWFLLAFACHRAHCTLRGNVRVPKEAIFPVDIADDDTTVSIPFSVAKSLCNMTQMNAIHFGAYLTQVGILDSMGIDVGSTIVNDGNCSTASQAGLLISNSYFPYREVEAKGKTKRTYRGYTTGRHGQGGNRPRRRLTASEYSRFCELYDHVSGEDLSDRHREEMHENLDAFASYIHATPHQRAQREDQLYDPDYVDFQREEEEKEAWEEEWKRQNNGWNREARIPRCNLCQNSKHPGKTCYDVDGNENHKVCTQCPHLKVHLVRGCPKDAICFHCRASGQHYSNRCPTNVLLCPFCGKDGHQIESCYAAADQVKRGVVTLEQIKAFYKTETAPVAPKRELESVQPSSFKTDNLFQHVGVLTEDGEFLGTVFVSNGNVYTAKHCVRDVSTLGSGQAQSHGSYNIEWANESTPDSKVTGYWATPTPETHASEDWAVLEVKGPIPKSLKSYYPKVVSGGPPRSYPGCVVSLDMNMEMSAQVGIVTITDTPYVQHTCTTRHGSSGAAVVISENSIPVVIAIHTNNQGSGINGAVYLPTKVVLDRIKQHDKNFTPFTTPSAPKAQLSRKERNKRKRKESALASAAPKPSKGKGEAVDATVNGSKSRMEEVNTLPRDVVQFLIEAAKQSKEDVSRTSVDQIAETDEASENGRGSSPGRADGADSTLQAIKELTTTLNKFSPVDKRVKALRRN